VVNEDGSFAILLGAVGGVFEVAGWGELVRMPGEVDVEGWDSHAARIGGHDLKKDGVFADKAEHGFGKGGRAQPVDVIHFLDECPLPNDCAD
jgi:hypothetical protein